MITKQFKWQDGNGWNAYPASENHINPQILWVFGGTQLIGSEAWCKQLQEKFPNAEILAASTAGEILGTEVFDNSLVATAVEFEKSTLKTLRISLNDFENRGDAGKYIASELSSPNLKGIFVLSDGTNVNGSALVKGINEGLTVQIPVTGGLAGDGYQFEQTLVGLNSQGLPNQVVAIGLYGENLHIGYGSWGGWDSFGVERLVTKAKENVLYELDGRPALDLYKEYLGKYATELPSAGLRFPLMVVGKDGEEDVVRTILNVDEEAKSLVFAGDIPKNRYVRLMRANFDKLVDGAGIAAKNALGMSLPQNSPDLALLVSCVGRKIVLDQRIEEEVEEVREFMGTKTTLSGFYSYGEICADNGAATCSLHNQTMTITTLTES